MYKLELVVEPQVEMTQLVVEPHELVVEPQVEMTQVRKAYLILA